MKKLTVTFLLLFALSAWSQETKPIQLALFAPTQTVKENNSISGVRLSLIYGKNVQVRGVDIGLVAHNTGGQSMGVQWAGVALILAGVALITMKRQVLETHQGNGAKPI